MRQGFAVLLTLVAVATVSGQQAGTADLTQQQRAEIELAQMNWAEGRPRTAVEARITTGAPYSAEAVTEFSQVLPDGNRIGRKTVTRVFRDSDGRARREHTMITPDGESLSITIVDPVARASYVLDPRTRVAIVGRSTGGVAVGVGGRSGGTGGAVARPGASSAPVAPDVQARRREIELAAQASLEAQGRSGASASGSGAARAVLERAASAAGSTTESLGQQMMEGVMVEGTRTTTTIPAGAIGNEQPITIVSEQWFSPDLQVLVLTRHSDPRSGESTYRLTNIVRGEPDRTLFEVPADYTVKEPARREVLLPKEPAMRER